MKDEQNEQLNAELKDLKSFIVEQPYVMKKVIEDLQGQKLAPSHSVVTESLKEGLRYLGNANLTKSKVIKKIPENQYLPSTSAT